MVVKTTARLVVGVVGGVGSIGGLISDFFMPIAPYGFYLGIGLLLLFFLSMALAAVPWTHSFMDKKLKGYWYIPTGLTIFLLSTVMFGTYFISSSEENQQQGWLASNIEVFNDMQQSLGLIQKDVHTIANATTSIDRKMDNVKKEISQNPRKELANKGVAWTTRDFRASLVRGDMENISLFLQGGFEPNLYGGANQNFFLTLVRDSSDENFNKVVKYLVSKRIIVPNKGLKISTTIGMVYSKVSERCTNYRSDVRAQYSALDQAEYMKELTLYQKKKIKLYMAGGKDYSQIPSPAYKSTHVNLQYLSLINMLTIAVWNGSVEKVKTLLAIGEKKDFHGLIDIGINNSTGAISPASEAKLFGKHKVARLFQH